MYKIKRIHLYSTLFVITLLESTVLNRIRLFGIQPDLLLISIVFFSLFLDYKLALEVGLAGGLFRDIVYSGFFGVNTFLFAIIAALISLYSEKMYKEFFLTQIFLTMVAILFLHLGYFFSKSTILNEEAVGFGKGLAWIIVPTVLYTSAVTPFVFFLLSRIFHIVGKRMT